MEEEENCRELEEGQEEKEIDEDVDRSRLLAVFPVEIWMKIFDKVEVPEELVTLGHASPFWGDLLEERRTSFLFPQVLQVLADQNPEYLDSSHYQDLLNFRLVSKTWRLGVNRVLESRPYDHKNFQFRKYSNNLHDIDSADPTYFRLYNRPRTLNKMVSEILPQLDSFDSRLSASSPFPSRRLQLIERQTSDTDANNFNELSSRETVARYRAIARQFLLQVGHHFWHVEIFLEDWDWCKQLFKYVQLLPNLRSLYIMSPQPRGYADLNQNRLSEEASFPTLEHLELLSLNNLPKSLMNAIVNANSHIKTLIIPDLRNSKFFSLRYLPHHIQNEQLETLNFNAIRDLRTLSVSMESFRMLTELPHHWNLQKLRLGIGQQRVMNLPAIFMKLECYKESLTELDLYLPRAGSKEDKLFLWESSKMLLSLPKLKTLEIEMRDIVSFDFLLGLDESLEHLRLHVNHYERFVPLRAWPIKNKVIVNFNRGYSKAIRKSNIWVKIPSLKTVELRIRNETTTQTFKREKRGKIKKI